MNTLQEYLMNSRDVKSLRVIDDYEFARSPRIICADGFSMSVQANHGAYCLPRTNIAEWTHVEVGFPSAKPEEFYEYAESSGYNDEEDGSVEFMDYTETVYPYVPIELVEACIAAHGGMLIVNNLIGMDK